MSRWSASLDRHLDVLSSTHPLSVSDDYRWVEVHNFVLPPGFNSSAIDVLVDIPEGYPADPPGVEPSRIFLPTHLRYRGRMIKHFHTGITPGWGHWAWFCYRWIKWNPHKDNLVTFIDMVRAHLTDPATS